MIKSYNIKDKYLYEILDDYKSSGNKEEIYQCFLKEIWHSNNSRQIFTKYIKFTMLPNLIQTDVGKIFYNYVNIPYIASKTMTKNQDYISLIRQKINNIYNNYCEPRLCTRKDYMELLHMPKKLYYRWEKYGEVSNTQILQETIKNSLEKANQLKNQYAKQKMNLTWNQFKPFVEDCLRKAFNNYVSLDSFENKNEFVLDTDLWIEDNFAIKYMCKCLQNEIKNFQKSYYGLYVKGIKNKIKYKRCIDCGKMFLSRNKDNQTIRCEECQHKATLEKYKRYNKKRK